MTHQDFRYEGTIDGTTGLPIQSGPVLKTALAAPSAQSKANDFAHQAASLAYRIRSGEPDPSKWKPLIAAAPEPLRELVREYLKQAYHAMQQRERVAAGGKKSSAGDDAMAALGKRYGTVASSSVGE